MYSTIACQKHEDAVLSQEAAAKHLPAEQYMPNATREIITLDSGVTVEKTDSVYVLGGDMILNERQLELLNTPQTRGAVIRDFAKYWPEGKVYYTVDANFGSDSAIISAMNMISNVAEITFIKRTNQPNYINFVPSSESDKTNSSQIGLQGGKQNITIYNRDHSGIIAHEIMHSLGMYHEMSRSDRDDYITINWNNILSSKKHNYLQYTSFEIGSFDYNSIMMYSSIDFAIDKNVYSFTLKDGSAFYAQRSYLSDNDAKSLRFIYGPIYYKIESVVDRTENYGQDYEDYWETTTYTITFYSDPERTHKITLNEDRLFKKTVLIESISSKGQYSYNTIENYLIAKSGSSSCDFEDRYYYNKDRGEYRDYYRSESTVSTY